MLVVEDVSKAYGSVRALRNVSLRFSPGEVHAVVGENGAGKSTLMSVLAGFVRPDTGLLQLAGKQLPVGRPFECRQRGIAMIHQHFTLVPEFTVAENIALARMDRLARALNVQELAGPALQIGRELSWEIPANTITRDLPVGVQQRVEILKNLANQASVLIFDEPTAVLSPDEAEDLFRVLRKLKDEGRIVILIAHKLAEVFAVADRISVLRRGELVASEEIGSVDAEQVAKWMVGEMPPLLEKVASVGKSDGLHLQELRVLGDRGEECVRGLSLKIAPGEVVGIGGVDGNGQVELAEAIAGVREPLAGEMRWQGQPLKDFSQVGYVPQDRQADGLALAMSVKDNLLIDGVEKPELRRGPLFNPPKIRSWAEGLKAKFDIRARSVEDPVLSLSGGNQQKVVVSRVLDGSPQVLLVVNPTRGLDLKASAFVHKQILEAANKGAAVLLISADLDELAALADRTLFISGGRLSQAQGASALVGA